MTGPKIHWKVWLSGGLKRLRFHSTGKLVFILGIISFSILVYSLFEWHMQMSVYLSEEEMRESRRMWNQGLCASCHSQSSSDTGREKVQGALGFHTENFKKYTHGKHEIGKEKKCFTCHKETTCSNCHSVAPSNHDPAFLGRAPANSKNPGHAVLAQLNSRACIACHQNPVKDCASCHSMKSVTNLFKKKKSLMLHWPEIIKKQE